ncbi:MAG: helix-turn-helix domain-containing protein [Verrucomicrobiota bacterium JB023]|nr:helix-turn-helix domain-containing protein [Verrucomicrobiota bacterium JB023]
MAEPWLVQECDFNAEAKSLVIRIDFKRGARFPDPATGDLCPVHDTRLRQWEHLRFFEHRTTLEARVPRIRCQDGSIKTVPVPWAEPNSGFTLLMEAFLLGLSKVMPVAGVSRQTGVIEDRIWHLIRARVSEAWQEAD